jgi:hypothetical protein
MKLANVARGTSKSVIIVAFVHASGRVTGNSYVIGKGRVDNPLRTPIPLRH